MIINDIEVRTPMDFPWGYDGSWRHDLARILAAEEVQEVPVPRDDSINAQLHYLKGVKDEGFENRILCIINDRTLQSHPLRSTVLANRLYGSTGQSAVKEKVEALLLCPEVDYAFIARHFNMDVKDIETFEKLFFNVRNPDGSLIGSRGVWEYFVLKGAHELTSSADVGAYWRTLAFEGGAPQLLAKWGWPPDNDIQTFDYIDMYKSQVRNVFRTMDKRLRFDQGMDARSIVQMFGDIGNRFAELHSSGKVTGEDTIPTISAIMHAVLKGSAPKPAELTEATTARHEAILANKLLNVKASKEVGIKEAVKSLDHITTQVKK